MGTHGEALRALADLFDEHPPEFFKPANLATVLVFALNKDEFLSRARALGIDQSTVDIDGSYVMVTRVFGPVKVQVYTEAGTVGERQTKMRPTDAYELHDDVREVLGAVA